MLEPLKNFINSKISGRMVGVEIKNERVSGELSSPRKALHPILHAFGSANVRHRQG